jgi:hypothetical protein
MADSAAAEYINRIDTRESFDNALASLVTESCRAYDRWNLLLHINESSEEYVREIYQTVFFWNTIQRSLQDGVILRIASMLDPRQDVVSMPSILKTINIHARGNAWTSETYRADEDNVYPGLCFCGFLLYYLVRGHCFPDGNKRVAWASAMAILASIGLTVNATDDESYDLVIRIAEGKIQSGMEVVQWLGRKLEAPEA